MWGNTVWLFLSYEFESLGDGEKVQEGKICQVKYSQV